ncbi:MAG: hypothetical protein J3K34DRAFT_410769 [Monoraphidium minutum]|nr:MAG: hypothetical protein J3K34DRAFT_410769 [Monoraphidium minutum]
MTSARLLVVLPLAAALASRVLSAVFGRGAQACSPCARTHAFRPPSPGRPTGRRGGFPRRVFPSATCGGHPAPEAAEAGVGEVVRLLQTPEDLARLSQLRSDTEGRARANQAALGTALGAQVDAARYGLELLDKSHRHIAKLRTCIDDIDRLCGEASALVENHDKIRALSLAHLNVSAVLAELSDIVDLPDRAAAVEELVQDDGQLVAAYEGLTVLEGTAANVEAWRRNASMRRDICELMSYLDRVGDALAGFEARLWGHVRRYRELARSNPRLLVDCARVVEFREQLDKHRRRTKAGFVKPRHYRERLLVEMEEAVRERAAPLLELCRTHGVPNTKVKYDQDGNRVVSESRDYLGALIDVVRVDPVSGRQLPGAMDAELAVMMVHEEEAFDEDTWVAACLQVGAAWLQGGGAPPARVAASSGGLCVKLCPCMGIVLTCPRPTTTRRPASRRSTTPFDALFQMYHVQVATAVDSLGQSSPQLTTKSQLAIMDWVVAYQGKPRGLGVQEELVRLSVAPLSEDTQPGLALLIESYTERMEATVTGWMANILAQDVAGSPQQMSDGALRTPGAVDFFRILNENVGGGGGWFAGGLVYWGLRPPCCARCLACFSPYPQHILFTPPHCITPGRGAGGHQPRRGAVRGAFCCGRPATGAGAALCGALQAARLLGEQPPHRLPPRAPDFDRHTPTTPAPLPPLPSAPLGPARPAMEPYLAALVGTRQKAETLLLLRYARATQRSPDTPVTFSAR